MTNTTNFLAFDLGAESGRAVVGRFDGDKLSLEEVHRFPNGPTRILDRLYWNPLNLFTQMKQGLAKAVNEFGFEVSAIGLDTWGVDFGLLDKNDQLIGNPYHYRDNHTDGMVEKAFETVPRAELFGQTGIQFIQLNSLFQLLALKEANSPALDIADTLLFMPDLFNYWFTGQKASEYTIASTSQCYNMGEGNWANSVMEKLGLPTHIFQDVVPPGTHVCVVQPVRVAHGRHGVEELRILGVGDLVGPDVVPVAHRTVARAVGNVTAVAHGDRLDVNCRRCRRAQGQDQASNTHHRKSPFHRLAPRAPG